jgi:hypothetical protein
MAAHLEVGHLQPPEQAEALGLRQVLRQVQQVQTGPMGVRRPPQRRLHAQVLPGPESSDTGPSGTERHPTTRRLPTTGPGDDARRYCRSTRPPRSSPTPRKVAARSAEPPCSPSRTSHRPRASGRNGWPPAPLSSRPRRGQAARRRLYPVSYTPSADTASAPNCRTPTSHQGLLEPDAGKLARPVLRGAGRSNAPGLPGTSRAVSLCL